MSDDECLGIAINQFNDDSDGDRVSVTDDEDGDYALPEDDFSECHTEDDEDSVVVDPNAYEAGDKMPKHTKLFLHNKDDAEKDATLMVYNCGKNCHGVEDIDRSNITFVAFQKDGHERNSDTIALLVSNDDCGNITARELDPEKEIALTKTHWGKKRFSLNAMLNKEKKARFDPDKFPDIRDTYGKVPSFTPSRKWTVVIFSSFARKTALETIAAKKSAAMKRAAEDDGAPPTPKKEKKQKPKQTSKSVVKPAPEAAPVPVPVPEPEPAPEPEPVPEPAPEPMVISDSVPASASALVPASIPSLVPESTPTIKVEPKVNIHKRFKTSINISFTYDDVNEAHDDLAEFKKMFAKYNA